MSDELAYEVPATVPAEQAELRPAPLAVLLLLFGAVPLVLVLQLVAIVAAALVLPLFDLAPVAAVIVAFIASPWRGVAAKWLKVAKVLALVMLAEWVPVWVLVGTLLAGAPMPDWFGDAFAYTGIIYLAESAALLVLVAIGSVASIVGILRAKRELRQETA
ncbi:MAG: hypothetical protein CVT59_02940 [Actinobacteria bacterium HGW-Actinobacteria-1]|jgi:hypothetical protein|nr:MAG: hypothetical protein CVT59_02940 [Actinobacteria bacterium HGW-Actinobacteria-1]